MSGTWIDVVLVVRYDSTCSYGGDLASTGSVTPWLRAQLLSRW